MEAGLHVSSPRSGGGCSNRGKAKEEDPVRSRWGLERLKVFLYRPRSCMRGCCFLLTRNYGVFSRVQISRDLFEP